MIGVEPPPKRPRREPSPVRPKRRTRAELRTLLRSFGSPIPDWLIVEWDPDEEAREEVAFAALRDQQAR